MAKAKQEFLFFQVLIKQITITFDAAKYVLIQAFFQQMIFAVLTIQSLAAETLVKKCGFVGFPHKSTEFIAIP